MMKCVVPVVLIFLCLNTSQANTRSPNTATNPTWISRSHLISGNPTPTKNVLARVVARPQRKFLIVNNLAEDDDNDNPPGPDELDLITSYTRNRISGREKYQFEEELSPYITIRLALARAKAMKKYREIWT